MITRIFVLSALFLIIIAGLYARFERLSRPANAVRAMERPPFLYYETVILFLGIFLHLMISIQTALGDPGYLAGDLRAMADGTYPFQGLYSDGHITYPPLYQYLFYFMAKILSFFHIPIGPTYPICIFFVKLPGIVCELLMSALIYRAASAKRESFSSTDADKIRQDGMRIVAFALILFNPGCMFISSYITQVDAIYTFFTLLTVYLTCKQHLKTAYFTFAVALMFKLQAIFIGPLIGFAIIDQVLLQDFNWKKFLKHLGTGLTAIACMALSYFPFIYNWDTNKFYKGGILAHFASSFKSWGWATQNAYNFWTLVGYNWKQSYEYFGPVSCDTWGTLFIILVIILSVILYFRARNCTDVYPLLGAVTVSGVFLFSVKMQPRYLYPAVVMLILGFALRPTVRRLLCVLLFSVYFFLVMTFDFLIYPRSAYNYDLIPPYLIAAYGIFCFGFLVYVVYKEKEH